MNPSTAVRAGWGAAALAALCLTAAGVQAAPPAPLSVDAQAMVHWVVHARDNGSGPFIVIDKQQARLWVFGPQGQPLGDAPVLLGLARGDDSVPGIGERPIEDIRPAERTTPAGRFIAERGRNADGEDIFWIDYDAAVSMHRVRVVNPDERRLQRLATPSATDNRISYGCINVPASFYDGVIRPLFTRQQGVVYVMPETRPWSSLQKKTVQHAGV